MENYCFKFLLLKVVLQARESPGTLRFSHIASASLVWVSHKNEPPAAKMCRADGGKQQITPDMQHLSHAAHTRTLMDARGGRFGGGGQVGGSGFCRRTLWHVTQISRAPPGDPLWNLSRGRPARLLDVVAATQSCRIFPGHRMWASANELIRDNEWYQLASQKNGFSLTESVGGTEDFSTGWYLHRNNKSDVYSTVQRAACCRALSVRSPW